MKKDEYSLDKKTVTKTDVTNLLQAAGFSKSNPYYIVPQGRVTFLTNASDKERFEVLKEVAGTKIYENHRIESLKIMDETGKLNVLIGPSFDKKSFGNRCQAKKDSRLANLYRRKII